MIYKNCIDACFDCVKAAERCACDCKESGCSSDKQCCMACAEICTLVGRLTARGCCTKEFYEFCAKICEECAHKCGKKDDEYSKVCALNAKKCADACRTCQADCKR